MSSSHGCVVDVFGQISEPICNYKNCYHKFSEHELESHLCQCHHPTNKTPGMSSNK